MHKILAVICCFVLTGLITYLIISINYDAILSIQDTSYITESDARSIILDKSYFGKAVKTDIVTSATKGNLLSIKFKLFNIFNIGTTEVNVYEDKEVFEAGDACSISFFSEKHKNFWDDDESLTNEISGIGTLSFVDATNKNFGAFGHALLSKDGKVACVFEGDIAKASVIDVEKSANFSAGELKASPIIDSTFGDVQKNTNFGVFGKVNNLEDFENRPKLKVGSKLSVKMGKAKLLAQIDGEKPKLYDIKIVKASKQNKKAQKGLVVKITDKELLKKCGGIVQGMSGSPIIQNGKFVGVLTHLFLNNPHMGYGVYADFMFDECMDLVYT